MNQSQFEGLSRSHNPIRDKVFHKNNVKLVFRKKLNEQRDNVVTELVVTEREFCRDLRMTCQVFHIGESNYLERKGIDGATLFGNVMEVSF